MQVDGGIFVPVSELTRRRPDATGYLLGCGMKLASALALSVAVLLAAVPACMTPGQVDKMLADLRAKELEAEKDADMRTFIKARNVCSETARAAPSETSLDTMSKCITAAEEATIAAYRKRAKEGQEPGADKAYSEAADCIERAPKNPPEYHLVTRDYGAFRQCVTQKDLALAKGATLQDSDYAAAEKEDTSDAWLAYIVKHKEDKRAPDAAKRAVKAAGRLTPEAQVAFDEKLAATYPAAVAELPAERRILLVGPKGLRVRDLRKMKEAKIAPSVMLARIKGSTEGYKNFDGDELAALKQLGLSDEVVTAMIEVTTKTEERQRANEERQAMRAELAALKAMIEEKKAATGGKGTGEVVQTKDGPMDVLASCAKRLSAMKLCEQIPFPGSMLCKSTAESSFPCPNG